MMWVALPAPMAHTQQEAACHPAYAALAAPSWSHHPWQRVSASAHAGQVRARSTASTSGADCKRWQQLAAVHDAGCELGAGVLTGSAPGTLLTGSRQAQVAYKAPVAVRLRRLS
jgi:hypothetical protein